LGTDSALVAESFFICLIAQQSVSQLEFVIRVKACTDFTALTSEKASQTKMRRRIFIAYGFLALVFALVVAAMIAFFIFQSSVLDALQCSFYMFFVYSQGFYLALFILVTFC